jgi:hypothetical protein
VCGSPCESTCSHPDPIFCKAKCQPGCFCKEGFVQESNGECVKVEDCQCGRNMMFNSCGTACPDTCDNHQDTSRTCTEQCVEGCFCIPEFVLNSDEVCVEKSECPSPENPFNFK